MLADHVCLTHSIKTLNLVAGSKEMPQSNCRMKNSTPTLNAGGNLQLPVYGNKRRLPFMIDGNLQEGSEIVLFHLLYF